MAKITGVEYENGEITSVFVQVLDEEPRRFEPARARGEWRWEDGYAVCPFCDSQELLEWSANFCPNCGADMRGTEQ